MDEPVDVPEMETTASSNPQDSDDVLTPEGWSPRRSDPNPVVTLDFPEEYPLVRVNFDTEDTEEVEVVVYDDNGDELDRQKPEVIKSCLYN